MKHSSFRAFITYFEDGIGIIALSGSVSNELWQLRAAGIDVALSVVNSPCSLATALESGAANLRQMGETLAVIYHLQR